MRDISVDKYLDDSVAPGLHTRSASSLLGQSTINGTSRRQGTGGPRDEEILDTWSNRAVWHSAPHQPDRRVGAGGDGEVHGGEDQVRERQGHRTPRLSQQGRGQESRRRSRMRHEGGHEVQPSAEGLHGEGREGPREDAVRDDGDAAIARGEGRRLRPRRRDGARSRLSDAGPEQVLGREEEVRREQGEGASSAATARTPPSPIRPRSLACIQKAQVKFDGGVDPTKGCFAKLEAKSPSRASPPVTAAALEAKVDAFAARREDGARARRSTPTLLDFALSRLPAAPAGAPRTPRTSRSRLSAAAV